MPTYPIFHCKVCDSAVQMESSASKNMFPVCGLGRNLLFSRELDSEEEFVKYCRGQGRFYAINNNNNNNPQQQLSSLSYYASSPVGQNHFNYSGTFQGLCCYCALGRGLCSESFQDVGCYHCKRRALVVKEFSKLKVVLRRGGAAAAASGGATTTTTVAAAKASSSSWESNGWAGLSNPLIDHILKMLVGEKTRLVFI